MTEQEMNVEGGAAAAGRKPILIVDSDPNNLLYLSTLLTMFRYRCATAGTAAEAFETVKKTEPVLIITALTLSDMNGLDLALRLKQAAASARIPFITLRRPDDLRGKGRSLELGAVDCLDLPATPELLYGAVQAATEKRPRKCIRLRTIRPVTVNNEQDTSVERPYSLDLSEGGMFLRTVNPAPLNSRLSVRFDLNGGTVAAEAVVLYLCQAGRGPWQEPGMGLAFVRIAPEDKELIRRFIREQVLCGINTGRDEQVRRQSQEPG